MSRVRIEWIAIVGLMACGSAPPASTTASRPTPASPAAPATASEAGPDEGEGSPEPAAPSVAATSAPAPLPSAADAGECPSKDERAFGILVSPLRPAVGQPVRVLAATLAGEEALALRVEGAAPSDMVHWTGAPAAALATVTPERAGELVIVAGRGGVGKACLKVKVRERAGREAPPPAGAAVWPTSRRWDSGEEALYSAWVRALFHAELGADLAYTALDQVTRDPARNVLHDALGWGEDAAPQQGGLHMRPDCADTPYFLRAYYAWKRGLPFAFRSCSRGGPGKPPRCGGEATSNLKAPAGSGPQPGQLGAIQHFLRRTLAWGVHTGNGRVALADERSDLYPVRLDRRSLRPGTVYADPYGHILLLVELFAGEGGRPGVLYAVDGQPDGSITRKRFWEGNFLWNPDPALGGSGFKNFRPVVVRDGAAVPLGDAEIAAEADYGDLSQEQGSLPAAAFYDRMEAIISPGTRDPFLAQEEAVAALFEQARVRVTSIGNGDAFFRKSPGATIAMPEGFAVFETTGAWESYSTPARDLRLLIAIDVVRGFSDKVRRQPAVFAAEKDLEGTIRRLEAAREELLADPRFRFEYVRSDGSSWALGLAELVARAGSLEVAYNPNDCAEHRWGAPAGSAEAATCKRRAPAEQQAKMERYREWFAARKRPARGT